MDIIQNEWWEQKLSEEILINVTPQETRIAMMENGVVQEIQIERSSSLGLVGNVYRLSLIHIFLIKLRQ